MKKIKNKRLGLLVENFLVYGLGSVLSKLVPLVMLPIVTSLMPNSTYYGISDLSNMIVSFGSAVAVMGMYDAMFRMYFEKEQIDYKIEICSSSLVFTCINGLMIMGILLIFRNYLTSLILGDVKYIKVYYLSIISLFLNAMATIVTAPTRMENKKSLFVVANIITPIIGYSVSIPLLLHENYLYALPVSSMITASATVAFFLINNRNWFDCKSVSLVLIKKMLKIGAPLMPAFLLYWIFSYFDRLMIGKILGNDYVGIYAIGARVASISQFIYTAFSSGWQYFAFSTMKDKDQIELTTKIFEYLGLISFLIFLGIAPFSKLIFELFFRGDYVMGYKVFPYLFLSPLLLMMYQTVINQFLIIKKTWPSTIILSFGAIINIFFNYLLISRIGIEGAAIATLLGYTVCTIIAAIVLKNMKLLILSKKLIVMVLVFILYIIIWRLYLIDSILLSIILSIIVACIFLVLYKNETINIIKKVRKG